MYLTCVALIERLPQRHVPLTYIHTEPISEAVKDDWTDNSSEEQGVEECLFNNVLNLEAKRLAMLEFPQIATFNNW